MTDPAEVVGRLRAAGATVGTGESLTAGLLAARLADVPGASAVLRGGIVAYATALKASLLDVPADLLAARGAVDPDVAVAMARGARDRTGSTYGVATTGVAGPDPQDGHAVGTVHVAVVGPAGDAVVRSLDLAVPVVSDPAADRARIRDASVRAALELLADVLDRDATAGRPH